MYRCTVSIVGVVRLLYGQPRNSSSIPYRTKRFLYHHQGRSRLWRTNKHTHTHTHMTFQWLLTGFHFGDKATGAWSWWVNLVYCSAWECSELYFKSPTLVHGLHREHFTLILQYWFISCGGYNLENSIVWKFVFDEY